MLANLFLMYFGINLNIVEYKGCTMLFLIFSLLSINLNIVEYKGHCYNRHDVIFMY